MNNNREKMTNLVVAYPCWLKSFVKFLCYASIILLCYSMPTMVWENDPVPQLDDSNQADEAGDEEEHAVS